MTLRRLSAALIALTPLAAFAAEPARLATLTSAWKGGPAKESGADYCVQEARFSSGHLLMIGRTRAGEVNIALGIPGGALPVGERWKVTVTADGTAPRERTATAAAKGLLVVGMGFDNEFFDRLKKGKTLNLKSNADDIGFQLSGTAKALGDLEKCAAGLSPAAGRTAGGIPGAGGSPFPETLTAILGAAGLREVQTLVFPDTPPEQRPADYAWRVGKVLGGVRERVVPAGSKFEETSANFAQALKERCKGSGSVALGPPERLPGVALRTGAVDCEGEGGKGAVHVSLVSYLSDANLFAVFFHEAVPAHKAEADDIRDRLADVFRKVAQQESVIAEPPRAAAPPRPAAAPPAPVSSTGASPAAEPQPIADTPPPVVAASDPAPAEPAPIAPIPLAKPVPPPAVAAAKPSAVKPAAAKPAQAAQQAPKQPQATKQPAAAKPPVAAAKAVPTAPKAAPPPLPPPSAPSP